MHITIQQKPHSVLETTIWLDLFVHKADCCKDLHAADIECTLSPPPSEVLHQKPLALPNIHATHISVHHCPQSSVPDGQGSA